jgi:hypothetical protein
MAGLLSKAGWIPWVGTAGVAMTVGFGLGRVSAPSRESAKESGGLASDHIVEGKGGGDGEKGMGGAFEEKNQDSTEDGLKRALGLNDPKRRDRELENSLSRASLTDVKKALDWALHLPDGAAKRAAMAKIMERWGQLDGANAAAYAEKLFAETGNPDLLRDTMRGWGQTDPVGSLQYAQSMPVSDGVRRDITRDLVRDWADRSPQAAAAYAASNALDVGRGSLTSLIADRWSKQDPQSAANWAMTLPAGREQQRAYDQLVQNWCDLNLQAAASFVSSQPAGENKDAMIGTLAREVAKQDPSAALKWAATLSDSGMQEETAWSVLRRSVRRDPEGTQQLLQSSALSAEVKQAVMTRMTNNTGQWGGFQGRGQQGNP